MGSYPGADLTYGIDVGEWEWDYPEKEGEEIELPWLTWELWSESWELETASAMYLESEGIQGVQLVQYAHPDWPRWALVTKHVSAYGWGYRRIIEPEAFKITDDGTRLLRAWELLFPGRPHGELGWRLSANYG